MKIQPLGLNIIKIILCIICSVSTVYAQKREIQEVKVGDNTYKVITTERAGGNRRVWIERVTDSLRYLGAGFDWDTSMAIKYDLTDIRQIIKKYIAPVLRQSELNFNDDKEKLFVNTIFDLDGNMRELAIQFPEKLKIPMTVVDDFFNAVLSSGIKCTYRKDHPGLRNAKLVYCNTVFSLKELQK